MDEEVPPTQLSVDTSPQEESQDRVPESPPLYTQENEVDDGVNDDVEAQISKGGSVSLMDDLKNATTIVYDNESPARCSKEDTQVQRKTSDVVIDMGFVEPDSEDFPDEDDALLVSAIEISEGECVTTEPALEIETLLLDQGSQGSPTLELDEATKAEEVERRKTVEGFKKFKPLEKIFPDVRCSEHNTVAFTIKQNYTPGDPLEPNPVMCHYIYDSKFIQMPYCNENVVVVKPRTQQSQSESKAENESRDQTNPESSSKENEDKEAETLKKIHVWRRIKESLTSHKILCSQDFVPVLKRYCRTNSEFKALDYCIEQIMTADERIHFFDKVVPFMISLVLQTPEIVTCPLPFLKKNLNHNISLSQKQVACLLANAFFSTIPRRHKSQMETPSINFKELFAEDDERIIIVKAQKIRCLINYFVRIEADMPQGVVTYTRKNLRHSNMPEWEKIDKGLTNLVPLLQGTIEEDGSGMIKVDFANSNIGGGVLSRGAVQEEILFVIYPELILARLFTEKLNFNEAVIVTGCERYSKYQGYSLSFKYDGDYQDTTPYDSKGRRCTQIVAIDALYISRPTFQYHPKHIIRELNKAYVGFHSHPMSKPVAIATGKWGCGAFNGDPQLKTIIQWLAASLAGRDVVVFTFGDVKCLNDIIGIRDCLKEMKIKDVWNLLRQYHSLCCAGGGKVTRTLKEFSLLYATNTSWMQENEEEKAPSSDKKLKEVPITNFYPSANKRQTTQTSEDASVAAITNGIDKINPTAEAVSTIPTGKRLREDEPNGLTESEIKEQLQQTECDSEEKTSNINIPGQGQINSEDGESSTSPKSSKRPKRLIDFYEGSASTA